MASKHHVYALFDNPLAAVAAYDEVQRGGCSNEHCSAIVHEHHIDEPERHLRALAAEVEAGKILIAVETDDAELESVCSEAFARHGGKQVVF